MEEPVNVGALLLTTHLCLKTYSLSQHGVYCYAACWETLDMPWETLDVPGSWVVSDTYEKRESWMVEQVNNKSLTAVYWVDWWETQFIPKNQNKAIFCDTWL